jgi:hypothetical protein
MPCPAMGPTCPLLRRNRLSICYRGRPGSVSKPDFSLATQRKSAWKGSPPSWRLGPCKLCGRAKDSPRPPLWTASCGACPHGTPIRLGSITFKNPSILVPSRSMSPRLYFILANHGNVMILFAQPWTERISERQGTCDETHPPRNNPWPPRRGIPVTELPHLLYRRPPGLEQLRPRCRRSPGRRSGPTGEPEPERQQRCAGSRSSIAARILHDCSIFVTSVGRDRLNELGSAYAGRPPYTSVGQSIAADRNEIVNESCETWRMRASVSQPAPETMIEPSCRLAPVATNDSRTTARVPVCWRYKHLG